MSGVGAVLLRMLNIILTDYIWLNKIRGRVAAEDAHPWLAVSGEYRCFAEVLEIGSRKVSLNELVKLM